MTIWLDSFEDDFLDVKLNFPQPYSSPGALPLK
jgi:hypothetical protein